MYPSTEGQQILSVDFRIGNRLVATLRIACVGHIPDDVPSDIKPPKYIDVENSQNI
jgi:hypothetical protein